VNFFGHLVAASWIEGSVGGFGLGAILPDLLPMCGATPADPIDPDVAAGIAFHHRTDAAFHDRPAFVELTREARTWLLEHGVARGPALGAAHVGIELLLDGALASDDTDRFEATLHTPVRWRSPIDAARFSQLTHGLLAAGVPGSYGDPQAVAVRLVRILARRPRLRLDDTGEHAMLRFADRFAPRVRESAPQILAELRSALLVTDA
jgi:acyl carrier protein phosphodiesterase